MKRNIKKGTALVLAAAMLAGLSGCSSKTPANDATTVGESARGTVDTAESAGAYADYSNGFKEAVTIQIPVYDRAFESWNVTDNYYTQWIQSEFGDKYNVNVEYVAITRTTEVNDFMQMLASGKAPDILFHYDMPQMLAYYSEGAVQELDLNEIAYYAPTYWEKMGGTVENYGMVEDGHYFAFADRPAAYNFVTVIRKDWLDQVNMEMPTCLEELNEVYAAWKAAGLGNGGGGLEQNAFVYDYPFRDLDTSDEEYALYSDLAVADFTWEPRHRFLKNMNYQFNHDLIDKEFYLNTDDAAIQADFISGASGTCTFYISNNTPVFDSLVTNHPKAEVAYLPLAAKTPKGNAPQDRAYWPFGMIMGINHSTTKEERAALWMYLEWMSDEDNLFFMQNGIEDENYTLADSGLAVKNSKFSGESKLSENNNKDYWCLITESAVYGNDELNFKANLSNWAPDGYEKVIEDSYEDYTVNAEYRRPDALFSVVLPSIAEYKAELNEKWKELYVKCVMAPEDQFEETYKAACEEYLASGYQEILDEKQAAIDAGMYR